MMPPLTCLSFLKGKIATDATILFFAGHGFQFEAENYLTSVNGQIPLSGAYREIKTGKSDCQIVFPVKYPEPGSNRHGLAAIGV